jgi:hypothetical protein
MARHRTGYSGELLSKTLTIKLTPKERTDLSRLATSSGLPVSAYARLKITGGHAPKPVMGRDPRVIRALAAQLAHLGNNLNQLARIANENGHIRHERALEAVRDQIAAALERIIEL